MASIVTFENVGLRYGVGPETLSDLSFSLNQGSLSFFTGPSGAGKTALLRLLYLGLRPSRGHVRLFGEEVMRLPHSHLPMLRRRIGIVFQDFRLVPHLSAFDNIALPPRIAGACENHVEHATHEMLAWVGLDKQALARPAFLSGGEQQRVAIARAMITRPALLVADEPTSTVDPAMAPGLLRLFARVSEHGTTSVIATHDRDLLSIFPQANIFRLDRGRLADRAEMLRDQPPIRRSVGQAGLA